MYEISIFNKIAESGLSLLTEDKYRIKHESLDSADGIVVRSYDLKEVTFPDNLKAIARAGAGVNNIPVEACCEKGIVVFNAPGANANGVKELTLLGMLISSRKICEGVAWARSLTGDVASLVEKGKKNYAGPELKGKTLGVVGLGAVGVEVANMGVKMGMKVMGYDPFLSLERALGLSWDVQYHQSLDPLLREADYISIHVPLMAETKEMFNQEAFAKMKDGVKIINNARGGLVKDADIIAALQSKKVDRYVTDFPNEILNQVENVVPIPHLGASTPESEDNSAVMAVEELKDFLENGNIVNSVNFPGCSLPRTPGTHRVTVMSRNASNIIGHISEVMAKHQQGIVDMINKTRGTCGYAIIDLDKAVDQGLMDDLMAIEGAQRVYKL